MEVSIALGVPQVIIQNPKWLCFRENRWNSDGLGTQILENPWPWWFNPAIMWWPNIVDNEDFILWVCVCVWKCGVYIYMYMYMYIYLPLGFAIFWKMMINHLVWGYTYSQTKPLVTAATISQKLAGINDVSDVQASKWGSPKHHGLTTVNLYEVVVCHGHPWWLDDDWG